MSIDRDKLGRGRGPSHGAGLQCPRPQDHIPSLRKGSWPARAGDTRGSWSLQAWSPSSSPVLGDFPMLTSFTSSVSGQRVPEAAVASPGEEREGQDARRTRWPCAGQLIASVSGSKPVKWAVTIAASGTAHGGVGWGWGAAAMKVRPTHTDPLESIGLGFEHGAEQSGEHVRRSDVQPQPRRDPPHHSLP